MSFVTLASKRTVDVREFLREASNTGGIRYRAEKNSRHHIFIPFNRVEITDEEGNVKVKNEIIALSGDIHDWEDMDGKYKTTVCLKDIIRKDDNGEILNDGSCPFCERISDAWDIYRYRYEMEEELTSKTGPALEEHMKAMKATFSSERKAKDPNKYLYLLVVQFRMKDSNEPHLGGDGLPEYDLKVMKLSAGRMEKIQQQIDNAGSNLAGGEIIFGYPNVDDPRLVVTQSTTTIPFPDNMVTKRYKGVVEKINADVSKFSWEGIEKSFNEWEGMTVLEAERHVNQLFQKWDEYKLELETNPNAKYLEYVGAQISDKPSLRAADAEAAEGTLIDVDEAFGTEPKAPRISI